MHRSPPPQCPGEKGIPQVGFGSTGSRTAPQGPEALSLWCAFCGVSSATQEAVHRGSGPAPARNSKASALTGVGVRRPWRFQYLLCPEVCCVPSMQS